MVTATTMAILVVTGLFCEQKYMNSRKLLIINFDGDGDDDIAGYWIILWTELYDFKETTDY